MAHTKVIIGDKDNPTVTLTDVDIISATATLEMDFTGAELPVDTCEIVLSDVPVPFMTSDGNSFIDSDGEAYNVKTIRINLASDFYAAPIWFYCNDELVGKFYLKSFTRSGEKQYTLTGQSAIGFLENYKSLCPRFVPTAKYNIKSYLPFFLETRASSKTASTTITSAYIDADSAITDFIDNVQYTGSADSASVKQLYYPISTRREVLQKLLFASNLCITYDDAGAPVIGYLLPQDAVSIPDDDIFDGQSIENIAEKTISVTEHNYTYSSSADITVEANKWIAMPTLPAWPDISNTSAGYYDYSANAAFCAAAVKFNYYIYSSTDSIVTDEETVDVYTTSARDVTADDTLINSANSAAIVKKLAAYYAAHRENKMSIVWRGQRVGRRYSFTNAYGEADSGYLKSMKIIASGIAKAECVFVSDFTPAGGAGYTNRVLLTGSGTWALPSGVTAFRAILIGGGTGGSSGLAGATGKAEKGNKTTSANSGGAGGTGGAGGKYYAVEVTSPASSYTYSCGAGGAGGDATDSTETSNAGTAGGNTTFGSYSSASGSNTESGITDILGSMVYAKGYESVSSASGGNSGYCTQWVDDYYWTTNGESVTIESQTYKGGTNGNQYGTASTSYCGGGFGGGAAYGNNGSDGSDGLRLVSGNGGNGADANDYPAPSSGYYGYGGRGGYGGGAGGNAGIMYSSVPSSYSMGTAGTGGKGGKGQAGSAGCVLIYY